MWTVRNSIYATVHNENGDRIATVAPAPDETDRARLIAAAPELLAMLQRLTHPMADEEDLSDALDLIRRVTREAA